MADEGYTWRIVGYGRTPHERIWTWRDEDRQPTQEELRTAVAVVVELQRPGEKPKYTTLRHPVGFGLMPFRTMMEDIEQLVGFAADRYRYGLVEGAP